MQHLDKLYKKHDIAWFTPVELFKVPFLALVLVNRMRFYHSDIDVPSPLWCSHGMPMH
jgi:hypothetical protein